MTEALDDQSMQTLRTCLHAASTADGSLRWLADRLHRTEADLEAQTALLRTVLDKFAGGPVGIDNLAAAIGEERDTIEDVLEPFLIQQGFLQRTSRGRMATVLSYRHFGLTPPVAGTAVDLFPGE